MRHVLVPLLTALSLSAAPVAGDSFNVLAPIPEGRCVIVVASYSSLQGARDHIAAMTGNWPYTQVFRSDDGHYRVTLGSLKRRERDRYMRYMKEIGRLPRGAYCSFGRDMAGPVDWRTDAPAAGEPYITADGRSIRTDHPDGSYTLRDLAGGSAAMYWPDGTLKASFAQVSYVGLPGLTGRHGVWAEDIEGRLETLAAEIIGPDDPYDFSMVGSNMGYFDRQVLRMIFLELVLKSR